MQWSNHVFLCSHFCRQYTMPDRSMVIESCHSQVNQLWTNNNCTLTLNGVRLIKEYENISELLLIHHHHPTLTCPPFISLDNSVSGYLVGGKRGREGESPIQPLTNFESATSYLETECTKHQILASPLNPHLHPPFEQFFFFLTSSRSFAH